MKAHGLHSRFGGNFVKRVKDFAIGAGQRDAVVRLHGDGAVDALRKITVRNENASAVFGDERMRVADFAAQEFHFRAGLAGAKNQWDLAAIDFVQCVRGFTPRIGALIEQSAVEVREQNNGRGQHAYKW